MLGKVVVITGATSGIGRVAAERLAQLGARLILVARDHARGAATLDGLRRIAPNADHSIHYADLASIADTARVGRDISGAEARIDVLVNNAGALFGSRRLSPEGLEMTFALNHLSYVTLTRVLRARLEGSAARRESSIQHRGRTSGRASNFSDLQGARSFRGYQAYRRSKLCNILFTRALARRLAGTGVTANSLHPGFVATRFGD